MKKDSIYLEFSNDGKTWRKVSHFLNYSVEADLYIADHAFSLELANPEVVILPGSQCRLHVNDRLELTGVVDHRLRRCDKKGKKLVVEGRDLMGVLVDAYVEEFHSVQGKTLGQLAEALIGPNPATGRPALPFINRKLITGQTGLAGKLDTRHRRGTASFMALFETPEPVRQTMPGMTVFQTLQTYALSSGVMFYGLPDGGFVFDRPLTGGDIDFNICLNPDGVGNNALSGEVDENISKGYSKVIVVGQRQGQDADGLDATRTPIKSKPVYDKDFPFYKTFVQCTSHDSQTPEQHARLILERMRHEATRLCYEMPRHSQTGKNYQMNRLAALRDEVHGKNGTYLITGRTFKLSKDDGPTTTLKLSLPGIVEDMPMKGGGRGK
jgi:prophage tail gpP-like protein